MNTEVAVIRELTNEEIAQVSAGAVKCSAKVVCDRDGCRVEAGCEVEF